MRQENKRITIHDLPSDEKPRERLLRHGADVLSSTELLAIIIGTGHRDENALQLAGRILAQYGGLEGLSRVTAAELTRFKGLGMAKSAQILAALALGQRAKMLVHDVPEIRAAADAAQLLTDMGTLRQEQVRVMLLDSQQRVQHIETVYIGTVNMSVLRVSEIYREAIVRNCPAIIVAHNHPSGNPTPSPEDIEMTRDLVSAGRLLDIQLIDHLIIGQNRWVSLRDMRLGFE